ncbi:MAG: sigma-70 family RNA polymerase sigma factor [Thermaurantiacus sp.]
MHAVTPTGLHARAAEPEALLAARVAAGDAEAFRLLARGLAGPGLALATRVLGDRALAEDAVQEALARLWREARRYDPARGSFGAWWRRVLMNCALDGRRRLRPVVPLEAAAHVADPAPGPEANAANGALARRLEQALAALPPRQRAALAMFHGEGHSMAEIAAVLETTEKAVEGLLGRARADLRNRLGDLADETG